MPERIADAEHQIERGVLQVVGQLVPARAEGSKRDTLLVGGLLGPANHPAAGVCGDHVKAKTRETDGELAGSTRAVEDARVGWQKAHYIAVVNRGCLGGGQPVVPDQPLVYVGKCPITSHRDNLHHSTTRGLDCACDSDLAPRTVPGRVSEALSRTQPLPAAETPPDFVGNRGTPHRRRSPLHRPPVGHDGDRGRQARVHCGAL